MNGIRPFILELSSEDFWWGKGLMEGHEAGDQLWSYFSKKMWSPVSVSGEEKGPESVWGHRVRNRKLSIRDSDIWSLGPVIECHCSPEEQESQSPRLSLTGVGDAKKSPPQTSKANPWWSGLGFWKSLSSLCAGKKPPAIPRAPFSWARWTHPPGYLLTSTLSEHKGSLQWEWGWNSALITRESEELTDLFLCETRPGK